MDSSHDDVAFAVNDSVRPILDLVDDLRKIGVQKDLPIPQVQVVWKCRVAFALLPLPTSHPSNLYD
jgi:hypothetical protein